MPESRKMGYARVSSVGQNLDRQIEELKKYVPEENILVDKSSGKDLERPGYLALKGPLGLRRGDVLVVTSLDRLSRSKSDIKNELLWFQKEGILLRVVDIPTTMAEWPEGQEWVRDMVNNILVEVLASMAEQERLTIRQRQREGIDAAKRKGKHLGRPRISEPENWDAVYRKWRQGEITAKRAMELCGLKKSKFYQLAKSYTGHTA